MGRTTEEMLRHWRQVRGLSVSELARKARVHRSTLTRWESGQSKPSIAELDTVLNVLDIPAPDRRECWQNIDRPRALTRLRQEETELPVALGDLIRALRLRANKTQVETARQVGVTQGLLARWENSMAIPDDERLHSLCFVLDASSEEVAALTLGNYRNQEPLPYKADALYDSFGQLTYHVSSSHKDLLFLAHAAQFTRLIRDGYARNEMLAEVWGRQAHHVQWRLGRDDDALFYGNTALSLMGPNTPFNSHLTATIIAVAQAWERKSGPKAGYRFLMRWQRAVIFPVYRHWVQANIARYLSESGENGAAVRIGEETMNDALRFRDEYGGDFLNRMWDYVNLLLKAGDGATALETLNQHSIFPSPNYELSDHVKEMLLVSEAKALVGQRREASDLLNIAQANVMRMGFPYEDKVQRISRLLRQ